jgi:hypothetical protein
MEFGPFQGDLKRLNCEVTEAIRLAKTKSTCEYQKSGLRFREMVTQWRDKEASQQASLAKLASSKWATYLKRQVFTDPPRS